MIIIFLLMNNSQNPNEELTDEGTIQRNNIEFIKKHADIFYKTQAKVVGNGKQFGTPSSIFP